MKNSNFQTILATLAMIISCSFGYVQPCHGQTDSTEIRLQHYKDLFIKGLITSQEYESLKQKELGLPPQVPPSVVVIQKEERKASKIDSIQAAKFKDKYRGNIAAGVGGIVMGIVFIPVGVWYYNHMKAEIAKTTGTYSLPSAIRRQKIITGVLCGFGTVSLGLGVAGLSVGISQRRKVKRYDNSLGLNIAPTSIGMAFNF